MSTRLALSSSICEPLLPVLLLLLANGSMVASMDNSPPEASKNSPAKDLLKPALPPVC